MLTYNHILQGNDATEQNARDHALGLDWASLELSEDDTTNRHYNYVDTINGVEIYYDYAANYYFFAPDNGKEDPHILT